MWLVGIFRKKIPVFYKNVDKKGSIIVCFQICRPTTLLIYRYSVYNIRSEFIAILFLNVTKRHSDKNKQNRASLGKNVSTNILVKYAIIVVSKINMKYDEKKLIFECSDRLIDMLVFYRPVYKIQSCIVLYKKIWLSSLLLIHLNFENKPNIRFSNLSWNRFF